MEQDKPVLKGETTADDNELIVEAEEFTEDLPLWVVVAYSLPAVLLANFLGFDLGVLGNVMTVILVTYIIAPFMASKLLRNQITYYSKSHERKMRATESGSKDFYLFNKRFELKWHVEEV